MNLSLIKRVDLFDKKMREIATLLNVAYAGVDTDDDSIVKAIIELKERAR